MQNFELNICAWIVLLNTKGKDIFMKILVYKEMSYFKR